MTEHKYTEIKKLHSYKIFKKHVSFLLVETIENFFNCSVQIILKPEVDFLNKHGINIHDNIKRGFYPISEREVLILGRIFKESNLVSSIGFHLCDIDVQRYSKLLNIFENLLTHHLSVEFKDYFQSSSLIFGDEIIKQTITNYLTKGGFDPRQVRHLIEYFFKLRTTSFEGEYFSTGAIFTKSHNFLTGELDGIRFGRTYELENPFYITVTNKIDKRIWYLVDGKTSFFLGNKNLCFNNIFILGNEYSSTKYLDSHSLSLTLKGGDFLIKVENEKLLSINTSDGLEFLFFENKWKFRDYTLLKELLSENISKNEEILDSIIFYIISCSKKQISTIIWFPNDIDNIDSFINNETKNSFIKGDLNITDKQAINHIFRCISSDGATIFNKEGVLIHMGVIINIEKAKIHGITGTGESAASVLKQNGVSIKVSQDGLIKIFIQGEEKTFYF